MRQHQKFLVVFSLVSSLTASLFIVHAVMYKDENVWLYPSDPENYLEVDSTFQLAGTLYYPLNFDDSKIYPAVMLFHGLTGNRGHCADLAVALQAEGFVCLTIDFRGHGESGGSFPFETPSQYNATFGDANGAYRFLTSKHFVDESAISAFGMSLGGGAALFMSITGIVSTLCAWYPGSAYILNNTPLYQHEVNNTLKGGYIIQGTDDECSRCSPTYTQAFVNTNSEKISVTWVEGGTHGTSMDYPFYKSETVAFLSEANEITGLNLFEKIIYYHYTPWISLGGTLVFALTFSSIYLVKKRKN